MATKKAKKITKKTAGKAEKKTAKKVDEKPWKKVPPENGRTVLAHGERTGHTHAFDAGADVELLEREGEGTRTLKVKKAAVLKHEEHRAIPLPPGNWDVITQKEYTPKGLRPVGD